MVSCEHSHTPFMKATLEFSLPEDQAEHSYALAGVDALLVVEDIINEVRNKLKYDGGVFQEWVDEDGVTRKGDDVTLEKLLALISELKMQRRLPDLS